MKERFKILKNELNILIKEKKKVFKNKIIEEEEKVDINSDPNKTKDKNKDIFYFLDLKYNILNDTLKKLSLLIQNEISENNEEMNNCINKIKENKNNIKKELTNDENNIENNLKNIKTEHSNYIQSNNKNNNISVNQEGNNLDKSENKLGQLVNFLDKSKKIEENIYKNIKKDLNERILKINNEIKSERNKINNINNNNKIQKIFDNINNELDKGKSYEYLKRNEYKETINSILNDILMKLEIEK